MDNLSFSILDFHKAHQSSIDELYDSIQSEYSETIYGAPGKTITELSELTDRKYWVVLDKGEVVATIGVVLLANNIAALKSMMIAKVCRGTGLADGLLKHAITFAKRQACNEMILGTMTQFVAAQKFYLKNGFIEIKKVELPKDFNPNPVDALFYEKSLING
jgi:N-acetylglutamate synthase-like GNAT family acetyltransferase